MSKVALVIALAAGILFGKLLFSKTVEVEKVVTKTDTLVVKQKVPITKWVPVERVKRVVVHDTVWVEKKATVKQDTVPVWSTKAKFISRDGSVVYGFLKAQFWGPPVEKFRFDYTPVTWKVTVNRRVYVKKPWYQSWTFGFISGAASAVMMAKALK